MKKLKEILRKRVNGGVLIYALFLTLFVATLASSLLLIQYYNNLFNNGFVVKHQLMDNIYSGVAYYSANHSTAELELAIDRATSVQLKIKGWGMYEVLEVRSKINRNEISKLYLCGAGIQKGDNTALYLQDKGYDLFAGGNAQIIGNIFIPNGTVRSAKLTGQSGFTTHTIKGNQIKSGKQLKEFNKSNILKEILRLRAIPDLDDSLISEHSEIMSYSNSFLKRTSVYFSNNEINLTNSSFKGNIVIKSEKSVILDSSSHVENIIIVSPYVCIRKGFKGNLQIVAEDSIIVQENCNLQYPSALVLYPSNGGKDNSLLSVETGCVFSGDILVLGKTEGFNNKLVIKSGSKVYGQIFNKGITELYGNVTGTVYASMFGYKTPSSYYQNYLINSFIDRELLSAYYVASLFFLEDQSKSVIQCLE